MNQDLRKLIETAAKSATKLFRLRGELLPMYHAIRRNGQHVILVAPPGPKDQSVALVRAKFILEDVVRYVFMDEAWIVEAKDREVTPGEKRRWQTHGLSDHPDRREVLLYTAEDASGFLLASQYILRPEHGPAKLTPLEFAEEGGTWSGRMVGLLPPARAVS